MIAVPVHSGLLETAIGGIDHKEKFIAFIVLMHPWRCLNGSDSVKNVAAELLVIIEGT
jgi:hypothetical protein